MLITSFFIPLHANHDDAFKPIYILPTKFLHIINTATIKTFPEIFNTTTMETADY